MTRINPSDPTIHTSTGTIEVSVDDYDMNDLDGEIARTLAACEGLCDPMSRLNQALRTASGD